MTQCIEFSSKSFSEIRSIVRDQHLRYRCLRPGHSIKECQSKVTSEVETCKSTGHHTLLHKERHVEASDSVEPKGVFNTVRVVGAANRPQGGAALDILPVSISGGDVEVVTYALLDPGSSMSFCESVLIDELRLNPFYSSVAYLQRNIGLRVYRLNTCF